MDFLGTFPKSDTPHVYVFSHDLDELYPNLEKENRKFQGRGLRPRPISLHKIKNTMGGNPPPPPDTNRVVEKSTMKLSVIPYRNSELRFNMDENRG